MSVNTIIKDGIVEAITIPGNGLGFRRKFAGTITPQYARDKTGKIWISTRHHEEKPAIRYANPLPYSHPTSWLMVGILDEKTLKVSGVKRIKPAIKGSPKYMLKKKRLKTCRIFWRKDGLHGIGVAINAHDFYNETRVYEIEILIDYKKAPINWSKIMAISRATWKKTGHRHRYTCP
jgi:hypothetical protein